MICSRTTHKLNFCVRFAQWFCDPPTRRCLVMSRRRLVVVSTTSRRRLVDVSPKCAPTNPTVPTWKINSCELRWPYGQLQPTVLTCALVPDLGSRPPGALPSMVRNNRGGGRQSVRVHALIGFVARVPPVLGSLALYFPVSGSMTMYAPCVGVSNCPILDLEIILLSS